MNDLLNRLNEFLVPWLVVHGVRILMIAVGAYILNYIGKRFIEKGVRIAIVPDEDSIGDSEKRREDTLIRIFTWTWTITLMVVATMMILDETGIAIGPILAGAGIVGIAIGFGAQYLIRDIITGFFIILENQYRIGDFVKFDATGGNVEDISLRVTTLRDLDGTVHHIPHGEIKRVSNFSKKFARINLNIAVTYDSELDKVIEVINKTGQTLTDDPEWKPFIFTPPKFMRVEDFSDNGIIIKVLGEVNPHKRIELSGEFRRRIKQAFDDAGIDMPYTQRFIQQMMSAKDDIPEKK